MTLSWTQPPFSFTPVDHTVTLTRVTGSGQVLCTGVEDSRAPVIMENRSVDFNGLEEFSTYHIQVSARFMRGFLTFRGDGGLDFLTLSAGKYS